MFDINLRENDGLFDITLIDTPTWVINPFTIQMHVPETTFDIDLKGPVFGYVNKDEVYRKILDAWIVISGVWKHVTKINICDSEDWKDLV